jgi:hypothetical protein
MESKKYSYEKKYCKCCDKSISYYAYCKHILSKTHIRNESNEEEDNFLIKLIAKYGQEKVTTFLLNI